MNRSGVETEFGLAMLGACEAALNAGLFYQTEFFAFVRPILQTVKPELICVEQISESMSWADRQALRESVEARVKLYRRGAYIAIQHRSATAVRYAVVMSKGDGTIAQGLKHSQFDPLPNGEALVTMMLEYEVYCCRRAVERLLESERSIEEIKRRGLSVGFEFRGKFEIGGKKFSTCVIDGLSNDGSLHLGLTRRGCGKRFTATMSASAFCRLIDEAAACADLSARVNPVARDTQSLELF